MTVPHPCRKWDGQSKSVNQKRDLGKTRKFLLDKLNAGKVTGRKESLLKVAEEMRKEQRN